MDKYYAIKDNKLVASIEVSPFTKTGMDELCKKAGFSTWFELDENAVLLLMGVEKEGNNQE